MGARVGGWGRWRWELERPESVNRRLYRRLYWGRIRNVDIIQDSLFERLGLALWTKQLFSAWEVSFPAVLTHF